MSGLGHITRAVIVVWQMLIVALRSIDSALRACCVRSPGETRDTESLPTTSPELDMETRTPSPFFWRRSYTFSSVAQSAAEKIHANNLAAAAVSEKNARISDDTANTGSVSARPAHTRGNSALSETLASPLESPNSPRSDTPIAEQPTASGAASKFRSVAWRIAKTNNRPPAAAMDALLKETSKQATTLVSGRKNTRKTSDPVTAKLKVHALRPQLKKMEIMHMMDAHVALVR